MRTSPGRGNLPPGARLMRFIVVRGQGQIVNSLAGDLT